MWLSYVWTVDFGARHTSLWAVNPSCYAGNAGAVRVRCRLLDPKSPPLLHRLAATHHSFPLLTQ